MSDYNFDTLKLPYSKTDWYDADQRMFDACFTILGQFVENELGLCKDYEDVNQHLGYRLHFEGDDNITAIDLWVWYKDYYKNIENDSSKDYTLSYINVPKSNKSEIFGGMLDIKGFNKKYKRNEIHKIKNEKLDKLMEIRNSLWT